MTGTPILAYSLTPQLSVFAALELTRDVNMAVFHQNSTDFILLGLNTHPTFPGFIFAMIFSIFLVAVTANVVMMLLIHIETCLHTPMYFLLSKLSIMDTVYIYIYTQTMIYNQDYNGAQKNSNMLFC